jgi:hypothetical protein
MDPNLVSTAAQPAIITWVQNYGNLILFFAQIIYWLGLLVFAGYAVATYKRFTNFKMGLGSFSEEAKAKKAAKADSAEKVSVEEFVE